MSETGTSTRKLTISLPAHLADFVEEESARLKISRSRLIARALAEIKDVEEAQLAAEGYRFYSQEAKEFAQASHTAVTEGWEDAG
jgi:metal-responsive CopG/Arc/MetJ family transcriptional regulator